MNKSGKVINFRNDFEFLIYNVQLGVILRTSLSMDKLFDIDD